MNGISLTTVLAWRYLKGTTGFASLITWTAVLGMALGVTVLIVVMSVMNGFERELRNKILGNLPHIVVKPRTVGAESQWAEYRNMLESLPGVQATAAFREGFGLLMNEGRQVPTYMVGIDPQQEVRVSALHNHTLAPGSIDKLQPGSFNIIIGSRIASGLGLQSDDSAFIVVPSLNSSLGLFSPRFRQMNVVDTFEFKADLDGQLIYLHYLDFAKLFRGDKTANFRVQVDDLFEVQQIQELIETNSRQNNWGTPYIENWQHRQGTLFEALQLERRLVALMLAAIIIIAAFNIVSSLVLSVDRRASEIAILTTIGAGASSVIAIFMKLGVIIALLGGSLGLVLGTTLALYIEDIYVWLDDRFQLNLFQGFFVNYLPSQLQWQDVGYTAIFCLILGFSAAIYPAFRASRINPIDIFRYG